ncbi:MAG: hypothetical protein KIT27_04735 [Legionellales bacterium]|nr:hypothetical protein [Legionellales bacterium]
MAKVKSTEAVAKLREENTKLRQQLREVTANAKKQLAELKEKSNYQLFITAETAYETGFNDALDELEKFTHARDQYLHHCEEQFEKDYTKKLQKSKSTAKKAAASKKK